MKYLSDFGILILRSGMSLLMMTHGWPKLQKLIAGGEIKFYDFMGLGPELSLILTVIGEFMAPLLIFVGLYTRWAAFLPAFTMAVAALVVHAGDPLSDREASLLFLAGFLTVLLTGPGRFSLDARLRKIK